MAMIRMKYRDKLPLLLNSMEPGDKLEVPYKLRTIGGVKNAVWAAHRDGARRYEVNGSATATHATVTRVR